jgi:hypothetical protein
MKSSAARLAFLAAAGLCASSAVAQADTFTFTSCHITGSSCEGGSVPASSGFGTVTLTQTTANTVTVDVALINGNKFVETGAGAGELFLFNATSTMTVSNLSATFNGTNVTSTLGGVQYVFHSTGVHADGTGDFTGSIECTVAANCNGNSIVTTVNDLHFTVTNATLAQLEVGNAGGGLLGNMFVADILCGATQPQCTGGLTGPVDVPVPGPVVGAGLPGLLMACAGLVGLARRRRQKIA